MTKTTQRLYAAGLAAALAGFLAGCGLVYTNVRFPRAYRSATPADVKASAQDELVTGTACSRSALFLFAWGDAGYAAASAAALAGRPDAVLYDVRADMKASSYVLGLYSKVCTVLTGKAGKL